jgi:hypothetical protein
LLHKPAAPSFQLDDPSVVASMPSEEPGGATVAMAVPPPRPVLGAAPVRPGLAGAPVPRAARRLRRPVGRPAPSHGLPAALASVLPPSIAAAITAPPPPSSPDSRFARAVAATMPSAERNDASMSFRVEADVVVDAFGSVPDEFGAPPQAQPVSTPPPSMPSGVKTQTLGAVPAPPLGGGTMKPGGAPPAPAPFELPPSLPPARSLGPAPQALSHSPGPMGRPSHAGLPAVSANLPAVGASLPAPAADPRAVIPALEDIGERLYTARAAYMVETQQGLTQTYNALKDARANDPRVVELRRLHEEMDRAVLAAYGWDDLEVPPYGGRRRRRGRSRRCRASRMP